MKWAYYVQIVTIAAVLSGCMHFAIEGDCPKTPDSFYGQETIHGSYYGYNWNDASRQVRKSDNELGLFRVEYRTNFFYALVGVITLGAYAPVDADYWVCAPEEIRRLPKKNGGNQ